MEVEELEKKMEKIWENMEWISEGVSHEDAAGVYQTSFEDMQSVALEAIKSLKACKANLPTS